MKFSRIQWLAIIVLDALLKAAFFFFFSLSILAIPLALFLTALHLAMFVIARACWRFAIPARRANAIAVLSATNVLFVIVSTLFWVSSIRNRQMTECFGVERACHWIEGAVTPIGRRVIAMNMFTYVVLNIIPFVLVMALSRRERPARKDVFE